MRWKVKDKEHPTPGNIRIKSEFLFLPKTIGRETRWLCFSKYSEIFNLGLFTGGWTAHKWED